MDKFHYENLLRTSICLLFWYNASIDATEILDETVHLNISKAYLDVKVNDVFYIQCTGAPPLTWKHLNPLELEDTSDAVEISESLNQFGNESVVRLIFHSEDATGYYNCRNDDHEASVYLFVNGDKLMISDIGTILLPGEDNYIPCFPTVSNASMTLWKTEGTKRKIPIRFDPTQGFIVSAVTEEFDGHFECVAEYGDRKEVNAIQLTRLEPTTSIPQIYINDKNATYVMKGSNFSLECFIQTDKLTKYESYWDYPEKGSKKANTLKSYSVVSHRNERNETFILQIVNATERDAGSYRCTALDHSRRSNFAEINITVFVTAPSTTFSFDCDEEEIIKVRNENVKLIAHFEVFPPQSDIRMIWKKDNRPVDHNYRRLVRYSNTMISLEISKLHGSDSGLYTVTTNVSGEFTKKSFILRVQDTPTVNIGMNPCCYSPKQNYILRCEALGFPSPIITWSWKPLCFNATSECISSDKTDSWVTFDNYYFVNNSTVLRIDESTSIISSLSVIANKTGYYKCNAANRFGTSRKEFLFLVSDLKEGFEIFCDDLYPEENTRLLATCNGSLVRYSNLYWKWIPENGNESLLIKTNKLDFFEDTISSVLELETISVNNSGTYICVATPRENEVPVEKSIIIKVQDSALTLISERVATDVNIKLIWIPVVLGILLMVLVIGCVIKIRHLEAKNKFKLQGFNQHQLLEGRMTLFDSNLPLDEQVDLLPYDERWEFPKEKLKLGRTLGQGAFGRVVKAEAFGINDYEPTTTVAVKMLKDRSDVNQQKSLMDELKILIHLGHHANIVNLMGAVTKSIQKDGVMVIVEFCRYGNLRHYLYRHRESFIDETEPETRRVLQTSDVFQSESDTLIRDFNSDHLQSSTSSSSGVFTVHNPNYIRPKGRNVICSNPRGSVTFETLQHSGSGSTSSGSIIRHYYRVDSQEHVITTSDLLCYAFQSARGMEYLASKKLIHRDLAARNVLLADDKIVKICDFGLAKDCYKYSNYVKKGEGPLPIKWMSIESIWDHIFTTKSDVWSFGILMWEIFTLGGNPYPGMDIDEQFYKKLKAGYRMEKPELCPDFAYQIMRHCWNVHPDKRPDFSQISDMIGNYLDENVKQHYIDVNEPYMDMNRKMKTPNYTNLECEETENPYVNSKVQDTSLTYDIPGVCRSIHDETVPTEPMEVVPMIQLESYTETAEELLQVNSPDLLDYSSFNIFSLTNEK